MYLGALGGIGFSIDGKKVLFTRDVSGTENEQFRELDSRIMEYDIAFNPLTEIDTEKASGTNDLDAKYSPDGGVITFKNTSKKRYFGAQYIQNC